MCARWAMAMVAALVLGLAAPARAADQLAALTPGAPAPDYRLSYDIFFGGLKFSTFDIALGLTEERYRIGIEARTAGALGWFYDWRLEAESEGMVSQDGAVEAVAHRTTSFWRGGDRSVTIDYAEGAVAEVEVRPPPDEDDREAVPEAELADVVDPMSAIVGLLLRAKRDGLCVPEQRIFDGRRRYNALLADVPAVELDAAGYSAYRGPAQGCALSFERIAGFLNEPRRRVKTDRIVVWVAPVYAGGPPVPVRLEADSSVGALRVHLTRARNGQGELVLGDAD